MHCLSCQSIKCALVVTAVMQIDRSGAVLSVHRASLSERPGKKRKAPPMPWVELFVFFRFFFWYLGKFGKAVPGLLARPFQNYLNLYFYSTLFTSCSASSEIKNGPHGIMYVGEISSLSPPPPSLAAPSVVVISSNKVGSDRFKCWEVV